MELRLKYNQHLHHARHATLLRGNDIGRWLQQVSSWHIAADELTCFIIPESLHTVKAAGLFVIFKTPESTKNIELLEPYTCIANRLFIPCNAALFPPLQDKELDKILLWHIQLFHPAIGLVGFEAMNEIKLADLCSYTQPKKMDWSFAHPGLAIKPAFESIIVTPPSADEVIDDLKHDIGQKPLTEIPVRADEKNTLVGKIADGIKTAFFTGLSGLINFADKILPPPDMRTSSGNAGSGDIGEDGWLSKLANWVSDNLADLQKKRDSEVQRLLNLFEHDTNEALQFAIPLNSPYLNRGSQSVSSKLSRNLPNFNLGKLGGGALVDAWDLGDSYHELRTKYLKAAQKEIAQRDFKKAAYVYAHLLGDYQSAANVLEQGNFHRAAAALYKDHLKNLPAAARSLENGKHYQEAIDLYKQLKQEEKIGDLYTIMQQEHNALLHFENCVTAKLDSNDYLDAARVMNEKMMHPERGKQTLLEGWRTNHQSEYCLKNYFDLIIQDNSNPVEDEIAEVYQFHTAKNKKLHLLNVMEYVNKKVGSETVFNITRDIAYEIVHEEAEQGNTQALKNLKPFLPGDRLIVSDIGRYNANKVTPQLSTLLPRQMQLDNTVQWIKSTWHRSQFLVIGIRHEHLQLARVNWYGNIEYHSWEATIEAYTNFVFINATHYSDHIILHSSNAIPIARKNLLKNKYFNDPLLLNCPIWLHKSAGQFLIDNENKICRLEINHGTMTLHRYSMDGDLSGSVNCFFNDDPIKLSDVLSHPQMVCNAGYFYAYTGMNFLTVAPDGLLKATNLLTGIRTFGSSENMREFFIVISTNKGCCLCQPDKGMLNFRGSYFAEKLIPTMIVFIAPHRFLIAEKLKVTAFEIEGHDVQVIHEASCTSPIAGVVPGAERNSFVTIEENGKITVQLMA